MCSLSCVSPVRLFVTPTKTSPPGSSVHEISQARILEWVGIPSPGDLPDPGIEPSSHALQADSLPSELVCLCKWRKEQPEKYQILVSFFSQNLFIFNAE